MRSMTGFGQAAEEGGDFRFSVTLRAVNHRFLDLVLRLRDEHREVEQDLRGLFGAELHRGRVEAHVEVEAVGGRTVEVTVDEAAAQALHEVCHELSSRGLVSAELSFGDLLRLGDVVQVRSRSLRWGEVERRALMSAAGRALEQLVAARRLEGEQLRQALVERLDALTEIRAELAQLAEAAPARAAASLAERIAELLAGRLEPNEDRLAQEVALLVDKSDVREELDRLASHLEHLRSILDAEGSIGKRLDFLAQEVFRELNTVGAKCRDGEMTRRVLDGKVCCEQIREQIQNVE